MTDEQLMQRYTAGDVAAFDELYSRHRGPLYRYLDRQINDSAMAGDLYQGAWEQIIRDRGSYRPTSTFSAWMYRIAHNHLVGHYRRGQSAETRDMDAIADDAEKPAQHTSNAERQQHLLAAIASLPPEQKSALLLKLETGLKMEEIADITGVDGETVKSRLRYAVNQLKRSVQA